MEKSLIQGDFMNKIAANTLYVVIATVFLFVLIMVLFSVIFFPIYLIFKPQQSLLSSIVIGAIIASLVGSFIIYNRLLKLVMKKTKLEEFLGIKKQE